MKTYPKADYYYVIYNQAEWDGTIVVASLDYEKELMQLASRISESSPTIEVGLVQTLSDVRDIVENILTRFWTREDVDRIMSEYDSEDDRKISTLLDYVECVLDTSTPEWIEDLCEQIQGSTSVNVEHDTIEELYEYWMDTKMPTEKKEKKNGLKL